MRINAWRRIARALCKQEYHSLASHWRKSVRSACEQACETLAKRKHCAPFANLAADAQRKILQTLVGGRQEGLFAGMEDIEQPAAESEGR